MFVGWISQEWAEVILSVIKDLRNCGHPTVLVDVTKFTYPITQRKVEDLLALGGLAGEIGVSRLSSSSDDMNQEEFMPFLENSVDSELLTKYRGRVPTWAQPMVKMEKDYLIKIGLDLLRRLAQLNSRDAVWILPNGRFSHQRALSLASKIYAQHTFFYEQSKLPNRYFFRPYSPHDRRSLETDFRRFSVGELMMQRGSVEELLENWRNPSSGVNRFNRRFDSSSSNAELALRKRRLAVFFTSSKDEFEALGGDWGFFGWHDQYHAFQGLGKMLIDLGFDVAVRIHPNLATKSSDDIRLDIDGARALSNVTGGVVFGPYSPVDSYRLLEDAELVIVARSTIGLEALALGKRVIHVADALYGFLPELRKFGSENTREDLDKVLNSPQPSSESAIQYLAFLFLRDRQRYSLPVLRDISFIGRLLALVTPGTVLFFLSLLVVRLGTFGSSVVLRRRLRRSFG